MRYLIIALSVLFLTACSETIMLSKPSGETVGTGTLRYHTNPPHSLTVTLNGKSYTGDVNSVEVDNSAELRKRYGANSKLYRKISEGLLHSTYHEHHYTGVLKAADGATLTCDYFSPGGELTGVCEDGNGEVYDVHR